MQRRDSVVGVVTRYGLDGSGFERQWGKKRFSFLHTRPDQSWRPPTLLYNGYRICSPGVKRLECRVNHPPPPSANVKNEWRYTSVPPLCLYDILQGDLCCNLTEGNEMLFRTSGLVTTLINTKQTISHQ